MVMVGEDRQGLGDSGAERTEYRLDVNVKTGWEHTVLGTSASRIITTGMTATTRGSVCPRTTSFSFICFQVFSKGLHSLQAPLNCETSDKLCIMCSRSWIEKTQNCEAHCLLSSEQDLEPCPGFTIFWLLCDFLLHNLHHLLLHIYN